MDEEHLKEYKIRVSYTVIIEQDESTVRTVQACSEDEAKDMIEEDLYNENDELGNIFYKIIEVNSCEPGHRDDKTADMFKGDKK